MHDPLYVALILLASAVAVVVMFRSLSMPAILGYLLVGTLVGPNALGLVAATEDQRYLAEFGVVFLMFSVGLEFSLPQLNAMRRTVFLFGGAQVGLVIAVFVALAMSLGLSWRGGLVVGGVIAMSSTAIVSKMLAERSQLHSPHGRQIMGVLLFQDLAVIPLLVLVPAMGLSGTAIAGAVVMALLKAAVVLAIVLFVGQRLMRPLFNLVARQKSGELFVLFVLLVTLGLAWVTEQAGLSLALGAFLAGMLISETEYRFQVEQDIKPFRDVLLGLFFVTVGMMLDLGLVLRELVAVLALFAALMAGKFALIAALSRAFGATPGTALRVGLALAQAGEFGFVLLSLTSAAGFVPERFLQVLLAAMILSMLATPFLIQASDRIVMRLSRSEWMLRSLALHRVAVESIEAERHVIILGYGRNGQRLARLLAAEGVRYVALDLDPERVREAAAAGDTVVFADSARREALIAAGIARAAAVVITFADANAALRVLAHVHELNAHVPVVVRARDEADIERLGAAGASEVVPEAFESGVMLASHTLVWLGMPLSRVMRRVAQVREEHYALLRGLFRGESDEPGADAAPARLHSVSLDAQAHALGRALAELRLGAAQVRAVRRRGVRMNLTASDAGPLQPGDVVVLLGQPDALAAAEDRLLRG